MLEEIGHYVDALLNKTDTSGDEGEYFALVAMGQTISDEDLSRIKVDDDFAVVMLNGTQIQIEQAINTGTVINNSSIYITISDPSYQNSGNIYNAYNAPGYIYNGGHGTSTGYIYNGYNAPGYIYNGLYGTGYIYNGYDGGIHNGYNSGSTGNIYNGYNSGSTGYLYNTGNIYNSTSGTIINNFGSYILNNGLIENQGTFTNNGTLAGSGRFLGALTVSAGVIAPGGNDTNNYTDTNGTFTIQGDFTQNSSAVLSLSLTNTSSFDLFKVTGNATFNGGSIDLIGLSAFTASYFNPGTTNLILIDGDSDNDNIGTLLIDSLLINSLNSSVDAYDVFSTTLTRDFSVQLSNNNLVLSILQNLAPTDLSLSATTINENVAANTVVGNFSSTDPDTGNTFTYSLVAGTGSTDNATFTINGAQLQINASPDFETQDSYSIRVRTTDQGGLSYDKALTIGVNNIPGDIVVTQTGGNTKVNQGGATDSYTVVLSDQPSADVVITLNVISLNGGTQLSTNVTSLTFTTANWNAPQTVTVTATAIDDTISEGPQQGVITATSSSGDSNFNAINIAPVQVAITIPRAYASRIGTANPFNGLSVAGRRTPTFADLDGDGDLDAIVGAFDGTLYYYKIVGSSTAPVYTAQTGAANPFNVIDVGYNSKPTLADIDGDLDAIIGALDGTLKYYENTGSSTAPVYTEQTDTANPFNGISGGAFQLADLDGDGDLDAIIGALDGTLKYYENTGSSTAPVYTAQPDHPFYDINVGFYSKPTFADLDGDGDLDAIIGALDGTLYYYKNIGNSTAPVYIARTGTANPFNGIDVGNHSAPTLADLDGDGDLDAIVGEEDGTLNYFESVVPSAIITPTGGNTKVTEGGATDTYTVVLSGQPSANVVITLNVISLNGGTQFNTNITSLTFTTANWNTAQTVTVTAVNDTIGEGPQQGVITATSSSPDSRFGGIAIDPVQVTITDNDLPTSPRVYVAQTGTANPFNGISAAVGFWKAPTLADIDGDGDLDAIVGDSSGILKYYKNTGSSTAPVYTAQAGTANPFGFDVGGSSTPTFADIDGDGDLDAIIGEFDGILNYYKNTGSSTAPVYTAQTGTANPFNGIFVGYRSSPTLADIDGDGDLDAIVGDSDGILKYYKNTGSSTAPVYTAQTGTANPFNDIDVGLSSAPTFADIDGDGDLDAIVGERFGTLNYYKNTGSSTAPVYTAQTGTANPFNGISVGSRSKPTLADLDGDGDLDVIVGAEDGNVKYFMSVPNSAPTVTSGASASFAENGTGTAYTVTGTDPDAGTTL